MPSKPIPVIDLFAGPGGLGEGFSKVAKGTAFKVVVSIEKDQVTHKTLRLRSFYRTILSGLGSARKRLPAEFLVFLKAKNKKEQDAALKVLSEKFPREWEHADSEALCLTLGEQNREINGRIREALRKNLDKNNKEKQQELFLINDIWQWKKYIMDNKLKLNNLPDNIKFRIPNKFIKKVENKSSGNKTDFEDKIKIYETQFNL